jgi:integrase
MTDAGPKGLPPGLERLGPNRWRIRAQARDRRTGKKIERGETFEGTQREAIVRQGELRAELRDQGARRKRVRLREYATAWLSSRAAGLKPSVLRKYEGDLGLHILPELGDLYLDSIVPADVRRFLDRQAAAGYAANTRLNRLRLLRVIAHDAQAEGVCPIYFCDRVRPPEVQGYTEEHPNLLTPDQLAKLLNAIPKQWLGLVMLISLTGMRWGEASALRWEDVDWSSANAELGVAGTVRIQRGNDHGNVVEVKTVKSRRTVPLPADVVPLLGARRAKGLIFPTKAGSLFRGSPLRAVLDKAAAAAGVPRITTHGLRRTFNNLSRQVADRLVTMSLVGHTTDAMHAHYSQVTIAEKSAAQAAVRALLPSSAAAPTTPPPAESPRDVPASTPPRGHRGDTTTSEGRAPRAPAIDQHQETDTP